MDLFFNPQRIDEKSVLPVPGYLKGHLLPWAEAHYREYPFGYSLVQRLVTRRFSIQFWHICAHYSGKLYPVCDKPTLALQAMITGEIPCKLSGFGRKLLLNSRYELFYVPASTNEILLEPGSYDSFHIELENGFLENIAENYPNAGELLNRFNNASTEGKPMVSVTMSYLAKAIIRNIRSCDKTGGDLTILLHRYTVDLLSEYVAGARDLERRDDKIVVSHKETLYQIREFILSEPNVSNQDLKKLCLRFGMNATELKRDFKVLFNQTPASFVRFHALSKANFLLTNTNLSIDLIADEVGYGYRSNFDKAFRQQYGVLPSKLRK